jgi:hypothetical protein
MWLQAFDAVTGRVVSNFTAPGSSFWEYASPFISLTALAGRTLEVGTEQPGCDSSSCMKMRSPGHVHIVCVQHRTAVGKMSADQLQLVPTAFSTATHSCMQVVLSDPLDACAPLDSRMYGGKVVLASDSQLSCNFTDK